MLFDDKLIDEAVMVAQFDHENVIGLVGACTAGQPLMVVLEYCENGSLLSFLRKQSDFRALNLLAKVQLAQGCARGMAYLASRDFIHRDLAARNVLLDSSYTPKIADFGMSRLLAAEADYYRPESDGLLATRWAAIEAIENHRFSQASDVW